VPGDHSRHLVPLGEPVRGMKADDAKRLKELEKENQRLRKLVANQALDMEMLREVARGEY
jgi:putative transposase